MVTDGIIGMFDRIVRLALLFEKIRLDFEI